MGTQGGSIQRIYKNAAGEVLAIDTVSMYGFTQRKDLYKLKSITGDDHQDWGAWRFHAFNGREVARETFVLGGARTVAEIEVLGGWSNIDSVNYDWFEFTAAGVAVRVDMTDLPNIGDTV